MGNSTNEFFDFSPELDQAYLNSLYEDDLSYAREVFEGFLTETGREFALIKEYHANGDIQQVRRNLHKIKPTFSFVGLTPITEESETVIVLCDQASQPTDIEPACTDLFEKIEKALDLVQKETVRLKEYTG